MAFADCKFPEQKELVVGRILNEGDGFYNMNLMYYSDADDSYIFEKEETYVQKEHIVAIMDDPTESELGLMYLGDDMYGLTDPDYVPSEESEDEVSEDESLVDEEEEEEEED